MSNIYFLKAEHKKLGEDASILVMAKTDSEALSKAEDLVKSMDTASHFSNLRLVAIDTERKASDPKRERTWAIGE